MIQQRYAWPFLFFLSCAPFCDVYKFNNPNDALSVWYDIIMPIINVHAPLHKTSRNRETRLKSLMRSAKKSYFDKLIELDKSTSTIWKAINEITNKSHKKTNSSTTTISRNIFNSHFLTLAETLAQSSGFISDNFACSKSLRDFCNKQLNPNDSFIIPPMTVLDVGK